MVQQFLITLIFASSNRLKITPNWHLKIAKLSTINATIKAIKATKIVNTYTWQT